jgi:NADP-dependent 3-hydroxy acid dehydrogenase YdfG
VGDYIEGKVIVITGAGGGFGRLVAQKCAARGGRVVAADIDDAALEETVASTRGDAGKVIAARADVTRLDEMRALARRAVDEFGALEVIVNNAGTMPLALYSDHEQAAEAWDRCIDINIKGVLHGIIAAYDHMIEQGRGQVINLSSIYGNYPVSGAAVYGATKAAVNVLSESLRQESQGRIKVTTIRPTGVPGTGLGAGVINPAALGGILGKNEAEFMQRMADLMGENPPSRLSDPDRIEYYMLSPEQLADQIVYVIDQPWGVSISDLTVRASGDAYMI